MKHPQRLLVLLLLISGLRVLADLLPTLTEAKQAPKDIESKLATRKRVQMCEMPQELLLNIPHFPNKLLIQVYKELSDCSLSIEKLKLKGLGIRRKEQLSSYFSK